MGDLREPLAGWAGGGGVSEILDHVRRLVAGGQFDLTGHGHAELNNDGLLVADVVAGFSPRLLSRPILTIIRAVGAGVATGQRGKAGSCIVGHCQGNE